MADQTKTIKVDVKNNFSKTAEDGKKMNKVVFDTKSAINDVLKSGKSYENQLKDVNKIVKETPLNVRDMNKQIQAYQSIALSAGRETPVGKQALKQAADLRDRYIDIQNETKRLADDQKNLQGVMQLASTGVAGFGAVQSAMALTGVESEELRETMVKLMAAQTLLNSINQISTALEKESSAMLLLKSIRTKVLASSLYAYATAQGVATKGLKLFRLALVSTGIGAIVVGIGLLVANFDKVKNALGGVTEKFKSAGAGVKLLMTPLIPLMVAIDLVKKGLQALGIIESEEEKAKEERHQANIRRIEKENKERKERFKARQKEFDREIAMLEAEGKSSFALRQKKIADSIAMQKQEAKAMEATIKLFMTYAQVVGENTGVLEDLRVKLAEVNEDIKDQENQLLVNVKTNNKEKANSYKEYSKQRENIARKIEDIENALLSNGIDKEIKINNDKFRRLKEDTEKNTKLTRTERNRLIALYEEQGQQKAEEIRDKYKQKEIDAERKLQKNLEKQKNDFLDTMAKIEEENWQMANLSQEQREIQAVKDKYFTLKELAKGNEAQLKEIAIARMNEENEIYLKFQNQRDKVDAASKQKQIDRENNLRNTRLSLTASAFDGLAEIVGSFNAKNEADAKKQFKITKALNLASAVTNTALAVTGALTAGGNPIKLATGTQFVEAGIAGAMGLANIAKIASATYESPDTSGSGSGAGSVGSGAVQSPNFNIVGDNNINQLASIQGQPTKAYVVSDEVTTAQSLDRKAQDFASL